MSNFKHQIIELQKQFYNNQESGRYLKRVYKDVIKARTKKICDFLFAGFIATLFIVLYRVDFIFYMFSAFGVFGKVFICGICLYFIWKMYQINTFLIRKFNQSVIDKRIVKEGDTVSWYKESYEASKNYLLSQRVLPKKYLYKKVINRMNDYVREGRVHDLAGAISLYEEESEVERKRAIAWAIEMERIEIKRKVKKVIEKLEQR